VLGTRFVLDRRPLVHDPLVGVKGRVGPAMVRLEIRAECGEDDAASRFHGLRQSAQHEPVIGTHETESALTDRDHRIELVVEGHLARVDLEERRTNFGSARFFCSDLEETSGDVDAGHRVSRFGECDRVSTRPAPHVEDPTAGGQIQQRYEELNLLRGSLREAVSQIGAPKAIGNCFEVGITGMLSRGSAHWVFSSLGGTRAPSGFKPRSRAQSSSRE
jgi:hypothetical protein